MKYLVFLLTIVLVLSGCNGFKFQSESALNGFSQRNKHKDVCHETGVYKLRTAEAEYECYPDVSNIQYKVLNP